jgi:uncharacterized protein
VKVVLDTNVVASAMLWGGKPLDLMQAARQKQIYLFTSVSLLAELTKILDRPKFTQKIIASGFDVDGLVDRYIALVNVVKPTSVPRVVPHDRDDDEVIAAAVTARAQLIITGDSDLLSLAQHNEIQIVTVAQALELMER